MKNKSKLILLVTMYDPIELDIKKWILSAKKINDLDNEYVELIFATNNPDLKGDLISELAKESRIIYVEKDIKKAKTVIRASREIEGDWLKVIDPDDSLIFHAIPKLLERISKISLESPLIEVGYKSFYEDGHFEIGNINRGFNHHAPNYSNIYNLKKLREIEEPKNHSFTVWDDYFLAVTVSKGVSIKDAPIVPIVLTNYYNNIGLTNTRNNNSNTYKRILEECVQSYTSLIDFFKNEGVESIHERNKLSYSQISYSNRLIVKSDISIFKRIKYIFIFNKFINKKYTNIDRPFLVKIGFVWCTFFKAVM